MKTLFLLHCLFGNLNELIEIYNNINKKNEIDHQVAFLNSCYRGHIDIVKQLLIWFPYIDISHNDELAFRHACLNGHSHIIKYLYQIKPNLNISAANYDALKKAIWNGQLNIIEILFSWNNHINLSMDNEYLFFTACHEGHLNIVIWLLEKKPDINIFNNNNEAFIHACKNNHSNIIKYLIDFNNKILNQVSFKYICHNGNLDVIKFIYNKSLTTNTIFNSIECFNIASDLEDFNIISFLIDTQPSILYNSNIKLTTKIKINLTNLGYNINLSNHWINNTLKYELSICSICMDKKETYIQTPCNHIFCKNCITNWLLNNNTCPNCRTYI